MNNLRRELAPISDAACAQIGEETKRTLERYLAERFSVPIHFVASGREDLCRKGLEFGVEALFKGD
jgi:uncharacterized linocin/CFP29 family protein